MFGVWFLALGMSVRDAVFRNGGFEFMVVGLWFGFWGEEFAAWGCMVWGLWLQGYLAHTKQPPP